MIGMATSAPAPTTVTAPGNPLGRIWDWFSDRAGLAALAYPVPAHANRLGYTLGGISFVGFLVLALSGFWLAQFYDPMPEHARGSLEFIQNDAALGAFVRGLHFWVANIVVITVFLHMVRVFATASFKRPRELNWICGVALLGVTIAFAFTGSVLKWDQEAWEALQHNLEVAAVLGGLGTFFSESFTQAVPVLARLYAAHVSILPLIATLLFVSHFFQVKHHGISPLPAAADHDEAPEGKVQASQLTARYLGHLGRMFGFGLLIAAIAAVLGLIFPATLGEAPDPSMEVTKPPFFFYWLYAFEDWFGLRAILYGGVSFFAVLLLVPFVDRSPWRSLRRRPVFAALGGLALVALVVLSFIVFFSPVVEHLE
jgi:quinol-cytochrome oxidoreductase complex cytochrome b subunit